MSTHISSSSTNATGPASSLHRKKYSYKELISFHIGNLEQYLEAEKKSLKSTDNHRTAINKWLEFLGLSESDPVGEELTLGFKDQLSSYLEHFESTGVEQQSVYDRRSILGKWHESWLILCRSDGLPAEFSEALGALLKQHGQSERYVVRSCDIGRGAIRGWLHGKCMPSYAYLNKVKVLEEHFGLQVGVLLSRLPDIVLGLKSVRIKRQATPFREHNEKLKLKRYRLVELTGELKKEWEAIVKFYTDSAWVASQGLERNGRSWKDTKGHARRTTSEMRLRYVQDFLGFLTLPVENEDPHLRGKGLSLESLSIALLSKVDFVYDYIQFRKERSVNKSYNNNAFTFLVFCSQLLRPQTGFLWQHPQYGNRLLEKITEENAWRELCADSHKRIRKIQKNIKENEGYKPSRDTMAVVKPLIRERQHPIIVLEEIAAAIRSDHQRARSIEQRAILFRDLLLFDFLISNPVCIGNISNMKYKLGCKGNEEEECNLYQKADGSWHLKYEVKELKNGYWRGRYDMPVNLIFWTDIEEYLTAYRPYLAGADVCDYVFRPTRRALKAFDPDFPEDRPVHPTYLSDRVLRNSQLYLPGCVGFSAHAARHFAATEWLKNNPGGYAIAAAILHDSEEVVRQTYSWVEPADLVIFWHSYLNEVIEKFREGNAR